MMLGINVILRAPYMKINIIFTARAVNLIKNHETVWSGTLLIVPNSDLITRLCHGLGDYSYVSYRGDQGSIPLYST